MRKILSLGMALMLCLGAQAQIVSSRSTIVKHEATVKSSQPTDPYNRIYVSYNPHNLSSDYDFYDDLDKLNTIGFTFGYLHGFSLSKKVPLFLEVGGRVNYSFKKETSGEDEYDVKDTYKYSHLNVAVPVNLAYRYTFKNGMSLAPYFGITFKTNILAKIKEDYTYQGETESSTTNCLDDDDMDGEAFKRFQVGWQVGTGLTYKSYYFGVHYGADFGEITDEIKTNNWGITIGYEF